MIYATWNEITDETKLAELVASMQANGWVGAPLVADNDQLLTGSHRYVAADLAGIEAPVVEIRDLVGDWDTRIDESGMTNYALAIEYAVAQLSAELAAEYGIDIH